jgi:dTDP-4-amino-4,6-dideoxygalactose transaminase
MNATSSISFIDVQAHREYIGEAIDEAISRVIAHGQYIMGPEVEELETALSERSDGRIVISCANGTDAMHLCLRAFNIEKTDAIFVPAFTFAATAEAVCLAGGTPVFVDIDPNTYNISVQSLEESIDMISRTQNLRPAGIISVDLFGQPAAYDLLETLASKHGLWLLEDAAQSFGAKLGTRPCGSFGHAATTSFFPAKPLGAYGDGGAIFVNDNRLAETLRSLRSHGMGSNKYENVRIGTNSRLDTIQAAILLEKLRLFDSEITSRDKIARRYTDLLRDTVATPSAKSDTTSVWAQYTIQSSNRPHLINTLKIAGIPTAIYYPHALPHMPAYKRFPTAPGGIPVTINATSKVLSIPMHAYLKNDTQNKIISGIKTCVETER